MNHIFTPIEVVNRATALTTEDVLFVFREFYWEFNSDHPNITNVILRGFEGRTAYFEVQMKDGSQRTHGIRFDSENDICGMMIGGEDWKPFN